MLNGVILDVSSSLTAGPLGMLPEGTLTVVEKLSSGGLNFESPCHPRPVLLVYSPWQFDLEGRFRGIRFIPEIGIEVSVKIRRLHKALWFSTGSGPVRNLPFSLTSTQRSRVHELKNLNSLTINNI